MKTGYGEVAMDAISVRRRSLPAVPASLCVSVVRVALVSVAVLFGSDFLRVTPFRLLSCPLCLVARV